MPSVKTQRNSPFLHPRQSIQGKMSRSYRYILSTLCPAVPAPQSAALTSRSVLLPFLGLPTKPRTLIWNHSLPVEVPRRNLSFLWKLHSRIQPPRLMLYKCNHKILYVPDRLHLIGSWFYAERWIVQERKVTKKRHPTFASSTQTIIYDSALWTKRNYARFRQDFWGLPKQFRRLAVAIWQDLEPSIFHYAKAHRRVAPYRFRG